MSNKHGALRSVGEVLGILPDSGPPSLAKRIVFDIMWFVYSAAGTLVMILIGFAGQAGADLDGLQRQVSILGLIVWILLSKLVPVVPRRLRLGTIPALVLLLFLGGAIRAEKAVQANLQGSEAPDCALREERDPPDEIHLDSLRLALIHGQPLGGEHSYLDAACGAIALYQATYRQMPPTLMEAFRAIRITDRAHLASLDKSLRFSITHSDDIPAAIMVTVQYCGADHKCGTCDDHVVVYNWPAVPKVPTLKGYRY
jgi:hypothetical protein